MNGMKLAQQLFLLWAAILLAWAPLAAQQPPCVAPPHTLPPGTANMFNEQQESDLGDAIAERVQREFKVIDDEVTEYLRRVGQRLLAQAPASNIRFRFYLVDVPEVNAYSLPGGRVYATRKLVAASRTEDELAGVLAHEIGHVITRQFAVDYTRRFQKILGITSLGNRQDVFEKYHQYMENLARSPRVLKEISKEVEDEQLVADRVALYLTTRAGYSTAAYSQFWNRTFEVGGKTGSFFSDLFGFTKPEQKRLREMLRLSAALPESCAGPRPANTQAQFDAWKATVLDYTGLGRKEALHAVEWRRTLRPALRGYISHLKFSRDGQYLLAQDAASIFVLRRQPFAVLFRIDARDALPAQFSPDSQNVVFYTSALRVEVWSVTEERRVGLHEMNLQRGCRQARLSPDGKYLACYDWDFALTLFEVATGQRVFHKKEFFLPTYGDLLVTLRVLSYFLEVENLEIGYLRMEFSPDGRHFLAARHRDVYFAYDLAAGKIIKLPDSIRRILDRSYGFMEGDRLVGIYGPQAEQSAVVSYPDGKLIARFNPGGALLTPATRGDYVLLRPITDYPVGVLSLESKRIFMASKQSALDLCDNFYVTERTDGTLSLFHADYEDALGRVTLPQSPLPRLRAAALSPDLNWLAVSERGRGAIWDLRRGERVMLTRPFRGAQFFDDGVLYADFPEHESQERMIAQVLPAKRQLSPAASLKDSKAHQDGRYLVELRAAGDKEKGPPRVIVSDVKTGKELWTRPYPKGLPIEFFNPDDERAVFIWNARSEFVKEEAKSDPELRSRLESKKESMDDYYLHVLESPTGKVVGKVYIETGLGSFQIRWAFAAGDYVIVADTENRILVYSVATGKQLGRIFGAWAGLAPSRRMLVAENEHGVLSFYSLPALEKTGQLVFSSDVSYLRFSDDGKRLFVLTADQTAILLDTTAIPTPQSQ
jgi:WD40 repeat protein